MKAYKYDDNKYYDGEVNCQLDPLETQKAGKDVWLLPANSTWEKPLKAKDGYKVKWNGEGWEYEKIPDPEPEPEPTEKELLQEQLWAKQGELAGTDYKTLKWAEGWISDKEYAPIKAQRQELRDEINELQARIDELDD